MYSLNAITSFLRKISMFNSHGSIILINLFKKFDRNVGLIIKFNKLLIFVLISYYLIAPISSIDLSKPLKRQLLIISHSVKSLFIWMLFVSFLIKSEDLAKFYQSIENNLDSAKRNRLQLTGFIFSCTWVVSTGLYILTSFQKKSRFGHFILDVLWAVYGIGFIEYFVLYRYLPKCVETKIFDLNKVISVDNFLIFGNKNRLSVSTKRDVYTLKKQS